MNFFMEIAKLRAARLLWSTLMAEKFAPQNPKSLMLRGGCAGRHTVTAYQFL
jgi:methylmalonyl-CoA mutase